MKFLFAVAFLALVACAYGGIVAAPGVYGAAYAPTVGYGYGLGYGAPAIGYGYGGYGLASPAYGYGGLGYGGYGGYGYGGLLLKK